MFKHACKSVQFESRKTQFQHDNGDTWGPIVDCDIGMFGRKDAQDSLRFQAWENLVHTRTSLTRDAFPPFGFPVKRLSNKMHAGKLPFQTYSEPPLRFAVAEHVSGPCLKTTANASASKTTAAIGRNGTTATQRAHNIRVRGM
jgi:hypothetical protein